MISLNLRSTTGKILLIFRKTKQSKSKRNYLAIQTVFRMEENLPFLREWLAYHITHGVDKFFLYDNVATQGDRSTVKPGTWSTANGTNTKYGISFSCFGYNRDKTLKEFNEIWEDFKENIIYIPWEPPRTKQ